MRHPLRTLLMEITGLLLVITGLFSGLEYWYASYETGADKLMHYFNVEKNTATTLWLGNSHVMMLAQSADSLEPGTSVSFAFGGMDLFGSMALARRYLDSIPRVKTMYIGVDEEWMGYNQTANNTEYVNRSLYRYTDTLYKSTILNKLLSSSNFFRANRDLRFLFDRRKPGQDFKRMIRGKYYPPEDTLECRLRAEEHSLKGFRQRLVGENFSFLHAIIMAAKKKGINVILFYPPKRSCYMHYRAHEALVPVMDSLRTFARSMQVPFLLTNRSGTFADSLFSDPDHLSVSGARSVLSILYTVASNDEPQTVN